MAQYLIRRVIALPLMGSSQITSKLCNLYSKATGTSDKENRFQSSSVSDHDKSASTISSPYYSSSLHLSPLLPSAKDDLQGLHVELVDHRLWGISSGLHYSWKNVDSISEKSSSLNEMVDKSVDFLREEEERLGFDQIEDMRLHGKLFYKLDRGSKEFEEYNFSFRRKKSSKTSKETQKEENDKKENRKKEKANGVAKLGRHKSNHTTVQDTSNACLESSSIGSKKIRNPTYNQLTDPYHLPFCLDIYISKSSVRACIVHRVTSKVVAVAHSISKDMKHDLVSTRDSAACVAVGIVLAQRAIEDDIYNVVYMPRKGETIEGKLQIVLKSLMDHGIDVKVKIKQRRPVKGWYDSW